MTVGGSVRVSSGKAKGSPAIPLSSWLIGLIALPMAVPVLAISVLALTASGTSVREAFSPDLPLLSLNTLLLCLGTSAVALALGVTSAALVTFFAFPLRRVLSWAAFLPMAMPGYIIAFVYVDFLTYSGPLQTWLRKRGHWSKPDDYWFPEIRSLTGAILVMGLVLYPYVYMAARAAFVRQPASQLAAARTLGHSPVSTFWRVVLPQARPALAVGLSLVIMECLNDIGAMSFFGVRTFAIAIYSTWLDQGNLGGAALLSLVMLTVVAGVVIFERWAHSKDGLPKVQNASTGLPLAELPVGMRITATAVVGLPAIVGFFLPLILLIGHGHRRFSDPSALDLAAMANSSVLAIVAAAVILGLSLVTGYAKRQNTSRLIDAISFLANLGYAIPGTVLAIGVIVPFSAFDHGINRLAISLGFPGPGLLLSGTITALIFAYVARFLVIATGLIDSGLERIPRSIDHAARTLGHGPVNSFLHIHVPLLRPALAAGALLVFVDALKELPATLLLRPFDFETLSTQVFSAASLGQIEAAALPALAIVLAGLVPVLLLMRGLQAAATNALKAPQD